MNPLMCRGTPNKLVPALNNEETKEDFCVFNYKCLQDAL